MESVRPNIFKPCVKIIAAAEINCAVEYKIQSILALNDGIKLNVQFVITGSLKDEIIEDNYRQNIRQYNAEG